MMKKSLPIWASLFGFFIAMLFIYGVANWLFELRPSRPDRTEVVTNRQYSLFLWQHPDIPLRAPFQEEEPILISPLIADEPAEIDRDLLPIYFSWFNTVGKVVPSASIDGTSFLQFLSAVPEWQPLYWALAPLDYQNLIEDMGDRQVEAELPGAVRQAFYGWQMRRDGSFAQFVPTYGQVERFLTDHPEYSPVRWRKFYPNYLKSYRTGKQMPQKTVPEKEVPYFLKQALYLSTKPNS